MPGGTGTHISQFLPQNVRNGLVNTPTPASAANYYLTLADLPVDLNGIYSGSGNLVAGSTTVTGVVTDRLTFAGSTTVMDFTSGADRVVSGVGTNPIGFGVIGDLNFQTTGSNLDTFTGIYNAFGNVRWQSQIYDNATFVENAGFINEVQNYSGTNRPLASMYYLNADGVTQNGFQANVFGERILSQASGLNRLSVLNSSVGIAFLSGAGGATGYIGVADQSGFRSWMNAGTATGWGGVYEGSGTVPTSVVATLTDNITWSGGTSIFQGVGTDETSKIIQLTNSASTEMLNVTDDGRFRMTGFDGPYDAGVAARNYVWDIRSNVTERTGGDGYNAYQFRNTFEGANSSNHYRTIYTVAPTGGVNPAFGRYAVYGDAFFALGAGNDRGVGVYGRAALSTTRQYGGWFQIVGQPATVQNRAVYANMLLSGGASAGNAEAGWFQVGSAVATHTGTFTGVLGFVSRAGAAIGVGTNIGGEFSALNGATNMAIRVQGGRGEVVFGAATPSAGGKLTVRGSDTTNLTRLVTYETLTGADRWIMQTDGQMASGVGTTALLNSQFAQINTVNGYNFGYGFYSGLGVNTTMTVQMTGLDNKNGITVATQGAKSGTIYGIQSSVISTGQNLGYGIFGNARNSIAQSRGVWGNFGGGDSVIPILYGVGVEGSAVSQVDSEQYGGRFITQFNNIAIDYTKDQIGLYAKSGGPNTGAATTSDIIASKFEVTNASNTSGDSIAILVPSSNEGVVVIGADNSTVNNSLVQVSGDLEIVGTPQGIVLEDRTTGLRQRFYLDNGNLEDEAA